MPKAWHYGIIEDNAQALRQCLSVIKHNRFTAHDGTRHVVHAKSICIHGDTPGAPARVAFLKHGLAASSVEIRAPL